MALPRARMVARATQAIVITAALSIGAAAPVEAHRGTEAHRVLEVARHQRGDPWVYGTEGPRAFDCSGFVYFAFHENHLLSRIGGARMGVAGYWQWFRNRGRASRHNGRRGDLVVWGNGRHIGIYLGRGMAISALTNGVQIHGVRDLTDPFTTFLHVRLDRG